MPKYVVTYVVTGDVGVEVTADNPEFARDVADQQLLDFGCLEHVDFTDVYVEEVAGASQP